MDVPVTKVILVAALAVCIFTVVLSCLNPFAPKIENSLDANLLVTEQKTIDDVLQNFKLAYFFRDSLLYSDLLESAFVFIYFDPELESSGRFVSWGRDTDLRTTGQLFRNFQSLNLVWESTVYRDTLEWYPDGTEPRKIESINRFSLKIASSEEGFDYDLWGKADFTFVHCPYDDKWRIVRWKDESYY